MRSNNIKEIRKGISEILNPPIISIKTIDKYIDTQLSDVLLNKNSIKTILESTNLIPYSMEKNSEINYFKQLWFLLNYNIPLNKEYSIFSNENRITKRNNEKGLGRAYNILSDNMFRYLKVKLYALTQYSKLFKLLERDYYEQYCDIFKLRTLKGRDTFLKLISNLVFSHTFTQRCILLKIYLDEYNATFVSFSKEQDVPYTSYLKTYKKYNNNNEKKQDKTQVFTYIFFKLYNDMMEKEKFDEEMKLWKNEIKIITGENGRKKLNGQNVEKLENMMNGLNPRQKYYKQKRDALIKAQKKYIFSRNMRVPLNIRNNIVNEELANTLFKIQKNIYNKKYSQSAKLKINPNTFTKSQKLRNYIIDKKGQITLNGLNVNKIPRKISQGKRKANAKAKASANLKNASPTQLSA
jgi:hypothetical protein